MIANLDNCEYSVRHGQYGGQAGDKDGIIYNNENWIVKYPKTTRPMAGKDLPSYTTSPLSEYLGSQIYSILGVDVHETMLGERNGKIVVACKDFRKSNEILKEVRSLKNAANKQMLEKVNEDELPLSATGDNVNLEELFLHFKINPLMKLDGLENRFWKTVIVDILINNNDRNNGNWGILTNEDTGEQRLAPVYDNGNAFNNKLADDQIPIKMHDSNFITNDTKGIRTVYSYHDKLLSGKKLLNFASDIPAFQEAAKEIIPIIKEKIPDILAFIQNVPEKHGELTVCSLERKRLYCNSLESRFKELIYPVYEKIQTKEKSKSKHKKSKFDYADND